jgi:hypothetical protein
MRALTSRSWLALAALVTHACALTGYDFSDYERATTKDEPRTGAGGDGAGGDGTGADSGRGESETAGVGTQPPDPLVASTFGVGDDSGAAGASANNGVGGEAAGQNTDGACQPRDCFEQGLSCGPTDDRCGRPLDCGTCFWWFQECRQNRCEIPQ